MPDAKGPFWAGPRRIAIAGPAVLLRYPRHPMTLLTVRQAAERLQVSLPTMRRLIAAGTVPVVVLKTTRGRRMLRVRPDTLEQVIREREHRPERDA